MIELVRRERLDHLSNHLREKSKIVISSDK
jgi:hypothetical protein